MRLESIPKLFAAKSSMISDSPRATATDSLTGTDLMAAIGLADLKSGFGLDLFLAKMGISSPDRAVESLVKYALTQTSKHKAIEQLDDDIKQAVVQLLANFAYQDYARSAASTRECDCCHGEGFIDAEVFTTKTHTPWVAKEIVKKTLEWGGEATPSAYEV
ncbi:antitermination protein, partial [Escherichia coli]|nr:antitermination protein [Escherichia coli]